MTSGPRQYHSSIWRSSDGRCLAVQSSLDSQRREEAVAAAAAAAAPPPPPVPPPPAAWGFAGDAGSLLASIMRSLA